MYLKFDHVGDYYNIKLILYLAKVILQTVHRQQLFFLIQRFNFLKISQSNVTQGIKLSHGQARPLSLWTLFRWHDWSLWDSIRDHTDLVSLPLVDLWNYISEAVPLGVALPPLLLLLLPLYREEVETLENQGQGCLFIFLSFSFLPFKKKVCWCTEPQ